MTETAKGNDHIRSDQQAFMEAYGRARERFMAFEGVEGVGFGYKETGEKFTDNVALVVFVRVKKPEGEIPADQRIPPRFEGYRTDVRVVPEVQPALCDNSGAYDPIEGGIQIASRGSAAVPHSKAGTLGCIVRRRGDSGRENVYLLSNKHVLYSNGAGENDYVYQPDITGQSLGPIQGAALYGEVSSTVPDAAPGSTVTLSFYVDCALALIVIDSRCFGSTCTRDTTNYAPSIVDLQVGGVNTMSDVRSVVSDLSIVVLPGLAPTPATPRVFKVGRTTGKTTGVVRAVNGVSHVGTTYQHNVIEIEYDSQSDPPAHLNCKGHAAFAESGDSGSVVVDEAGRVIGLVYAIGLTPPAKTYACHILPVLDKLGVCIPVAGGTSHGSCGATDGSGIGPSAVADAEGPDGDVLFAASTVATAAREHAPPTIVITEDEQAHLLALRDALRESELGRELHGVFATLRREIGYLVRNSRPVKVAWHRCQGPAFLAHTLKHLKGDAETVPLEINGITRTQLLTRMESLLVEHGSNPLRDCIQRYADELRPLLATARTVHECLEFLRQDVTPRGPSGEHLRSASVDSSIMRDAR